jgi:hypothetical protein
MFPEGKRMPYVAEISRQHPTCFLFVIDQSASMDECMEGGRPKADFVADVLNKTLYQLVIRCTRHDGVRDYFHVGVLGYSDKSAYPAFGGSLGARVLHPISVIEEHPLRIEDRIKKVDDGAGGIVEQEVKFPVWFEPRHSGGTPMCEAVYRTAEVLVEWCNIHTQSYPPTIIHVTDGQSTDGDPEPHANEMKQLRTDDGQCLFFNLHIDTRPDAAIIFPSSQDVLPDQYSALLFRMSSTFPPHLVTAAKDRGYSVSSASRFFGYKAGHEGIVDFFDIGTRASQMR